MSSGINTTGDAAEALYLSVSRERSVFPREHNCLDSSRELSRIPILHFAFPFLYFAFPTWYFACPDGGGGGGAARVCRSAASPGGHNDDYVT
jgi:hypothetical protein